MSRVDLEIQITGLETQANNLSSVSPGSLKVADNVNANRDNILETRRGFAQYGNTLSAAPDSQFTYRDRIFAHVPGSGVVYDSNGSGAFLLVGSGSGLNQPSGIQSMRGKRLNSNLYVTTGQGVYKLDALGGNLIPAGAPKALDGSYELTGDLGFLPDDTAVAYRLVWLYTDANDNEIVGSPSSRVIAINTTGQDQQVQLTFQIPDTVTSNYSYKIYRSVPSADATATPNDELQLCYEQDVTSAELSSGFVVVLDNLPDTLLGEFLYTDPSRETILQSNDRPPLATDIEVYREHLFFVGTSTAQEFQGQLLGVGEESFGYINRFSSTTSGSAFVTVVSGTDFRVGMRIDNAAFPGEAFISSVASSGVYADVVATGTGSPTIQYQDWFYAAGQKYYASDAENFAAREFMVSNTIFPGQNIQDTTLSMLAAVNQNSANEDIYGYYLSGAADIPGLFLLEARDVAEPQFFVASTAGTSFSPQLSTALSSVGSQNNSQANRIYYSKASQPEAVPATNFLLVGTANEQTLRIRALRDSLFICRGDGTYQLTGQTPVDFQIRLFDGSLVLDAPETLSVLENSIIMHSNLGFVQLDESGRRIIDRKVENIFDRLSSSQFPNFRTVSFGLGYDVEHMYMVAIPSAAADTYPTQIYTWNTITDAWTRWPIECVSGLINPADEKIYLAYPDRQLRQERKTFATDGSDFADEEYSFNITAVSDSTITVDNTTGLEEGQTVVQEGRQAIITDVTGSVITLDDELSWSLGEATAYTPIATAIAFNPIHTKNPGILKHWIEGTFFFLNPNFDAITVGFATNFKRTPQEVELVPVDIGAGWGSFDWGTVVWGQSDNGPQPIRTFVPIEATRGVWSLVTMELAQAFSSFSLQGFSLIYEIDSERFRSSN